MWILSFSISAHSASDGIPYCSYQASSWDGTSSDGFSEEKASRRTCWTLLEYLLKHKATRSGSSTSQKYHCNGLEFDNPADMEDYKNAQGLK